MRPLLKAMRPKQWAKNVLVFAGIFFDGRILDWPRLAKSLAAFVIFCLASSAIYLINDLADLEKDRIHPVKCSRPLASGELSPSVAIAATVVFLITSIAASFALNNRFMAITLIYISLMVLYTFLLKQLVIIDVMTIALGFVLRIFAGALAVDVTRFSPWLYVCGSLLALFIAINKRRHELRLLTNSATNHRTILGEYSITFLDEMTALVTSSALVSYSFYTFSAPNLPQNHSMMFTIPFVMYGLFRYLYLIHTKNLGGAPEDIILGDRPLLIAIALWALISALVIYWRW